MTNCEKCGKQLVQGVKKCGYCGHPAPESITPPSEDSKNIWNELSSLTQWAIIILIPLAILGNFIAGIIGALIGYFWLAPWAANFAKEHNRSINWGYFFGFLGPLSCVIYWLYVKLTTDPLAPSNSSHHNETTIGEWVVLALSLIYAFIATFSGSTNGSIANTLGVFIGSFILSLIVLYIIYWIIGKLSPGSKNWSFIVWILAMIGIPLLIFIIVAVGAAFIFGMAGSTSNGVQTVDTVEIFQRESYAGASTFTNNDLHFTLLLPQDWESYTIDSKASSAISSDSAMSEAMMPKIVYLYTKNYDASKLMVMIMGMDFSKSSMPDMNVQSLNDGFIEGLKQGLEKSQSSNIIVKSKGKKYQINGFQSCGNEISYTTQSGIPSSLKIFVIKNGSKFYVIYYQATDDVYNKQIATFEQIVGSFTPTN